MEDPNEIKPSWRYDNLGTHHLGDSTWKKLIQNHDSMRRISNVELVDVVKSFPSTCSPFIAVGKDEGILKWFVVKSAASRHLLIMDLIVSRIGETFGHPVPAVELVELKQAFLDAYPSILTPATHKAGIAFASSFLHGTVNLSCEEEHFPDSLENRTRISMLGTLFGLMLPQDRQFLMERLAPYRISGIDFGQFLDGIFPTADSLYRLQISHPEVEPDKALKNWSFVKSELFNAAAGNIELLTDELIGRIVAEPPDEWGIDLDLRVAIADTIATRRNAMMDWRSKGGWKL